MSETHEFKGIQDALYPSLCQARCSCGWHQAGFVKLWLALKLHAQHVGLAVAS